MSEATVYTPTTVLLDLDGTITDSTVAITVSVAKTLHDFGHAPLSHAELLQFAGPPLRQGFAEIVGAPAEQRDSLVRTFRHHYRARMLQAPLYAGTEHLLDALAEAAIPIAVATSKVRTLAVQILEHHRVSDRFTAICGANDDETGGEKADVISVALKELARAGADLSAPLMVGDRRHDIEGAAAHGIPAVLAGWGFGGPSEGTGALATANSPVELTSLLGLRTLDG